VLGVDLRRLSNSEMETVRDAYRDLASSSSATSN